MLGQVRRVSGSRAIYSSASEVGGSVGGSAYGGSVFGDEEPQPELRPQQTRPHTSMGRPQTSLGRPQTAAAAAAGRRRSGSASIVAPGRRRSGSASLVQAQRERELMPREQSVKDRDRDIAVSPEEPARAVGQIQVPRTRSSVAGSAIGTAGTAETRRVFLKRGDGGAIRGGGARRASRGSSALPRPSSRLE